MQRHQTTKAEKTLINDLAKQTGRTYEEALSVYESQLERAQSEARVPNYVTVIAGKRAKEALTRRH